MNKKAAILLLILGVSDVTLFCQTATPQPAESPVPAPHPPCTSYALANDRLLSSKANLCYFVQKELFSMGSLGGAAFAANYSQWTQSASDLGKGTPGFATRFSTNYAQSAAKSAGEYLSRFILREDPRRRPPYVEPRPPLPRGAKSIFKRIGHSVADNFIAYRCPDKCEPDEHALYHYKRVPAISRMLGSAAGAYSSMLWAPDRINTPARALRRVGSTYGGTFGGSFILEFQPELAIGIGKMAGWIAGIR